MFFLSLVLNVFFLHILMFVSAWFGAMTTGQSAHREPVEKTALLVVVVVIVLLADWSRKRGRSKQAP
jgi:hypothetical protein